MIPVLDVFAGPGGLGEGFSSFSAPKPSGRFRIALSIEKDAHAHQSLRLRAFLRQFASPPAAYLRFLRGETDMQVLAARHPAEWREAESEARLLTLSPDASAIANVRRLIRERVDLGSKWVLIGGPPCQAYSLVGRARNRGRKDYNPDTDHRQTLYEEYLQILADHSPPVFVMENVKGLLSAQHREQPLFKRILEDLHDPRAALRRNGRRSVGGAARYRLHSLVHDEAPSAAMAPDFVVRTELFGVPQRRHRVILVGIREDVHRSWNAIEPSSPVSVGQALKGLPKVRSGLSEGPDSLARWTALIGAQASTAWVRRLRDDKTRHVVEAASRRASTSRLERGGEHIDRVDGERVLNHSTRGHMSSDLARYLFVSSFGEAHGRSPDLSDFPTELLPEHANVQRALGGNLFSDRFRVQLATRPSTTITSHISKDGHYFIHPDPVQCRSLTVREAARLQSFPDNYFFCGPRTSQYTQVGNAVPPELARQIAGSVARLL